MYVTFSCWDFKLKHTDLLGMHAFIIYTLLFLSIIFLLKGVEKEDTWRWQVLCENCLIMWYYDQMQIRTLKAICMDESCSGLGWGGGGINQSTLRLHLSFLLSSAQSQHVFTIYSITLRGENPLSKQCFTTLMSAISVSEASNFFFYCLFCFSIFSGEGIPPLQTCWEFCWPPEVEGISVSIFLAVWEDCMLSLQLCVLVCVCVISPWCEQT